MFLCLNSSQTSWNQFSKADKRYYELTVQLCIMCKSPFARDSLAPHSHDSTPRTLYSTIYSLLASIWRRGFFTVPSSAQWAISSELSDDLLIFATVINNRFMREKKVMTKHNHIFSLWSFIANISKHLTENFRFLIAEKILQTYYWFRYCKN